MRGNPSIEEVGHVASPKPKAWLYDHGFTTPLINNRQKRNGRASNSWSCTKSILSRWCGCVAFGTTPRWRHLCLRRRIRIRSCRPSVR